MANELFYVNLLKAVFPEAGNDLLPFRPQDKERIESALERLKMKCYVAITLRLGHDGKPMSAKEAAKTMGFTRSGFLHDYKKGLRDLKYSLRKYFLRSNLEERFSKIRENILWKSFDHDWDRHIELLASPISVIPFPKRILKTFATYNYDACTGREREMFIAQLVKMSAEELLEIRGLGKKSVQEVEQKLAQKGLRLGADLTPEFIAIAGVLYRIQEYLE
ncbi:MAG: DNA-directed RNA polymerase subunit alpha C-terminal domain-containing protein [Patescibacteria group bacterium]|nr:DNA-directed RNA polymerase subunit alpha C-terminal domain-containing protein [Patescibacteria group bacterium]